MAVKPVPDGYHTITPHLIVKDAGKAIEFYKKAFGAEELFRMPGPDGKSVMHAEIRIGDSPIMICDENKEWNCLGPKALGGSSVTIHVYVKDADATFKKAVAAGATEAMALSDMFWGDRYGKVTDPFGHSWSIATHVKDLTPEQIQKGAMEAFSSHECGGKKK